MDATLPMLAGMVSKAVFDLPAGADLRLLHTFYLFSSALMLYWYVRCRWLDANALRWRPSRAR